MGYYESEYKALKKAKLSQMNTELIENKNNFNESSNFSNSICIIKINSFSQEKC